MLRFLAKRLALHGRPERRQVVHGSVGDDLPVFLAIPQIVHRFSYQILRASRLIRLQLKQGACQLNESSDPFALVSPVRFPDGLPDRMRLQKFPLFEKTDPLPEQF